MAQRLVLFLGVYACHEGNYRYMTNTLRAGRVQDGTLKVDTHPTRTAAEQSGK